MSPAEGGALHPLAILLVGIVLVLGTILVLRLNAFLSLVTAALVVSLLGPGPLETKAARVAGAFGEAAAGIGIVIALAAIVGHCLMASGAADRIVETMLGLLGERRTPTALALSGYVLSVPVFYDTVFYLLLPLARSLHRRTGRHYVLYVLALATGAIATHSLVPPTPGPLVMAERIGIDLGLLIAVGGLVGLPAAAAGLAYARWADGRLGTAGTAAAERADDEPARAAPPERPPSAFASHLPVVLPVALIAAGTVGGRLAAAGALSPSLAAILAVAGNANVALLVSAAIALVLLRRARGLSRRELAAAVETALSSAGVIILITAAGGAFGGMLRAAGIGPAVQELAGGARASGTAFLLLGFASAAVVKIAQGSGTVSMITVSATMAAMLDAPGAREALGFHPVYLATAIGSGSMVGTWMNDSAFWIYARMGGFSETETLRTWTVGAGLVGATAFAVTLALSRLVPLV